MLKVDEKLLNSVPDFFNDQDTGNWIQRLKQLKLPLNIEESNILSMEWSDLQEKKDPLLGHYASEKWRKFVLATFMADLLSYNTPVDQVNFERLLFVMHAFPQGFRTWWIQLANDSWIPVGYTGWYPMLETTFELFERNPEKLKDRMVVPQLSSHYLYLFNFSVVPTLKKTPFSRLLMKGFLKDINEQQAQGLACITVSEDGVRVANSLEMSCKGHLTIDGIAEDVFTVRC